MNISIRFTPQTVKMLTGLCLIIWTKKPGNVGGQKPGRRSIPFQLGGHDK